MSWSDEPTDSHLGALYSWIRWKLPTEKAQIAIKYLRENSTRQDVSQEMKRVRTLYYNHSLNADNALDSEIYDGFEPFYEQKITTAKEVQ